MRDAKKNSTPIRKLKKLMILISRFDRSGARTLLKIIVTTEDTKKKKHIITIKNHVLAFVNLSNASRYLRTP